MVVQNRLLGPVSDVEDADHVVSIGHCQLIAVIHESAVDIVDGDLKVEVVIRHIFALPHQDCVFVGVDKGENSFSHKSSLTVRIQNSPFIKMLGVDLLELGFDHAGLVVIIRGEILHDDFAGVGGEVEQSAVEHVIGNNLDGGVLIGFSEGVVAELLLLLAEPGDGGTVGVSEDDELACIVVVVHADDRFLVLFAKAIDRFLQSIRNLQDLMVRGPYKASHDVEKWLYIKYPTLQLINYTWAQTGQDDKIIGHKIAIVILLCLISGMKAATSQIQKHFQLHTVYKRSRRFMDIERMNQIEHHQQIYRRIPNHSIQTIDTRLDSSFMNSAEAANLKLNHDLTAKRKRYQQSLAEDETHENNQKSITSITMYSDPNKSDDHIRSKNKLRAPDMSKMPPRKQFGGTKPHYRNESQFNNYQETSRQKSKMVDFSLLSPRSRDRLIEQEKFENPETYKTVDTARTYQKNSFNQTVMKCLFDLKKKQKKSVPRKGKNVSTELTHELPFERIQKAEKHVTKNLNPTLYSFYQTINRETPSQMDNKLKRNNQFFYLNLEARKSKEDFSTRKRKEIMETKRLWSINHRKQCLDSKQEMCDQQFFMRKQLKTQRQRKKLFL